MTTMRGLVDKVAGEKDRVRAERPAEELVRLRAEVACWKNLRSPHQYKLPTHHSYFQFHGLV